MSLKRVPVDLALWVALPMAQRAGLEGRIRMIVDGSRSRHGLTRGLVCVALLGAAGLAATLATAQTSPLRVGGHRTPAPPALPAILEVFTPWTSYDAVTTWGPRKTYRLVAHLTPRVQGSYPDRPVRALLVSGPGRVANFSVRVWKPGKSNVLLASYDYTPVKTDKAHPDVIHLLTGKGDVASEITWRQR